VLEDRDPRSDETGADDARERHRVDRGHPDLIARSEPTSEVDSVPPPFAADMTSIATSYFR